MSIANFAAGANDELQRVLVEKFIQQVQQKKLAQEQQQIEMQARRDALDAELGRGRLGLDRDELTQKGEQFNVGAGFDERKLKLDEGMQPVRLAHTRAQTGDILRKPEAEAQERQFITGRDRTIQDYDMQKIGATGAEQRRTEGVRIAGRATGQPQQSAASSYSGERGIRIQDSVNELVQRVTPWTAGVGSWLAVLPATQARDFKADLDQLKANVAFSELTEMREASKTGGALGQVSNIELGLLQSALGALDQEQSVSSLQKNLRQVADISARWQAAKAQNGVNTVGMRPQRTGSAPMQPQRTGAAGPPAQGGNNAAQRAAELLKKYGG